MTKKLLSKDDIEAIKRSGDIDQRDGEITIGLVSFYQLCDAAEEGRRLTSEPFSERHVMEALREVAHFCGVDGPQSIESGSNRRIAELCVQRIRALKSQKDADWKPLKLSPKLEAALSFGKTVENARIEPAPQRLIAVEFPRGDLKAGRVVPCPKCRDTGLIISPPTRVEVSADHPTFPGPGRESIRVETACECERGRCACGFFWVAMGGPPDHAIDCQRRCKRCGLVPGRDHIGHVCGNPEPAPEPQPMIIEMLERAKEILDWAEGLGLSPQQAWEILTADLQPRRRPTDSPYPRMPRDPLASPAAKKRAQDAVMVSVGGPWGVPRSHFTPEWARAQGLPLTCDRCHLPFDRTGGTKYVSPELAAEANIDRNKNCPRFLGFSELWTCEGVAIDKKET